MEGCNGVEPRRHERLYEPFPVLMRATDARGEVCETQTVLDNLSAGGLYVRLARHIEPGTKLFAVVRLATATDPTARRPCVAVRGVVLRAEP